ncbi:hypothetical protein MKUB_36820 [Mycobacterium kubicae]|uniref:CsbD family protein n=1 Tax=Mycobacterium kubicae TaxID=120959 RepID=A0AAX1JAL3_9MYCO|nr:hypothetical protein [Mycobacterium kubicae]MCV7094503.1 hypothetical protein [Mycobacterium kubicae]QPI37530.1 hypothetical protein I2456_25210 [Mycobacterium kubicae]GFG66192.1 hypothetical protein MKUB_36820 [Mycobacterium kubicae]
MRAEEGDESVKDYAKEGEQTLNRINETQGQGGSFLSRIGRRVSGFFGSGSGSRGA